MIAHHLGMIGRQDDDGVLPHARETERRQDIAKLGVDLGNHPVVDRPDFSEGVLVPVGDPATRAGQEIVLSLPGKLVGEERMY